MQDAGQFRQDGLSADRAVAELRSAPAVGSRKKAISLQQSVLSLYIENRQSTIGNSSHPGPSDDRRKSPPHEKKMKTGATMILPWSLDLASHLSGRLRRTPAILLHVGWDTGTRRRQLPEYLVPT